METSNNLTKLIITCMHALKMKLHSVFLCMLATNAFTYPFLIPRCSFIFHQTMALIDLFQLYYSKFAKEYPIDVNDKLRISSCCLWWGQRGMRTAGRREYMSGTCAVCFIQFGWIGYPSSRSVVHRDFHSVGSDPGLSTCIAAINLRKRPFFRHCYPLSKPPQHFQRFKVAVVHSKWHWRTHPSAPLTSAWTSQPPAVSSPY
jgi:hypothetical protein